MSKNHEVLAKKFGLSLQFVSSLSDRAAKRLCQQYRGEGIKVVHVPQRRDIRAAYKESMRDAKRGSYHNPQGGRHIDERLLRDDQVPTDKPQYRTCYACFGVTYATSKR